jgi:HK97 gp10 family phage protein
VSGPLFGAGDITVIVDQAAIDRLLEGPSGPVAKHLLKIVQQVERRAKQLAPVDTGRLRSSITHSLGNDSDGLVGLAGTNVEYARHVEFGTSRMGARAFLRPALDEVLRKGP